MKRKIILLIFIIIADLLLLFSGLHLLIGGCAGEQKREMSASGAKMGKREVLPASDRDPDSEVKETVPSGEKFLALTFDDGPHSVYTKKLLDGLRERNVHASFFLVGENIEGNEELVKQMMEDGHLIGTHCYSHEDLTKKSAEKACMDIIKTNDMLERITGQRPVYIRPPYGSWNDELEECVGMDPVFWDIDTLDWKSQNSQKVVQHICKNVGKHQVILLHDVFETSVDAALAAIDTLTLQGYTFVTVDELLID